MLPEMIPVDVEYIDNETLQVYVEILSGPGKKKLDDPGDEPEWRIWKHPGNVEAMNKLERARGFQPVQDEIHTRVCEHIEESKR